MVAYQPMTAFGLARQAEYQPTQDLVLARDVPLPGGDYTPSAAVVIAIAEGYAVTADFRLPVDRFIPPAIPVYQPGSDFRFVAASADPISADFIIGAGLLPPALITLQLGFSQAWRLWVSVEMPLSQRWSLQANPVWTPVISATVYRFALENSQGRAEMPISNFSGQLRSGEPSYLQVTIPDARRWAQDIADFAAQSDTEMVIQAGYRYSDGSVKTQDIARTRLRNVRYDLGARSSSVQLDGIDTRINPTPKSVTLTGANYRSQDESGRVRYRCAMNFDIHPGDTALINGESFQVGEVSYNVTVNNATLEIAA
jgi:hypothetical protein